jgi:hypothetical protein
MVPKFNFMLSTKLQRKQALSEIFCSQALGFFFFITVRGDKKRKEKRKVHISLILQKINYNKFYVNILISINSLIIYF